MSQIADRSDRRSTWYSFLNLWLIALALFSANGAFASTRSTTCDELRRLQLLRDSALVIVDVRPPGEFAQGHIEGARDIAGSIESAGLPRDGKIVVYCTELACPLSKKAAERLAANGYSNVTLLDGGMAAWMAKGYPVVKDPNWARARPKWSNVPAAEANKRLAAGAVALDVRSAGEFAAGHLPGARNMPLETLDAAMAQLPKDVEIIVYDRRFQRERAAMRKLTAGGFRASALAGGLAGWAKGNLPIEVK